MNIQSRPPKTTSPGAVELDLDPTDKVLFFADSGSPGGPN